MTKTIKASEIAQAVQASKGGEEVIDKIKNAVAAIEDYLKAQSYTKVTRTNKELKLNLGNTIFHVPTAQLDRKYKSKAANLRGRVELAFKDAEDYFTKQGFGEAKHLTEKRFGTQTGLQLRHLETRMLLIVEQNNRRQLTDPFESLDLRFRWK